ncbi:dnaJ subfamily B member 3 isoform X1 [Cinnamomum micranthum f. kanehirae]|uniref:DnaJ subfamily B member 3 isoform X1 n=1 Tax=Cinnamomum micranthum f. kanehirae TaxID=337451 RepID=A0A443PU14_9MAGN|nr:dnaJ subfamily B member 3 isoform X1 [Cinnamomum micranthum f. kanehirae]
MDRAKSDGPCYYSILGIRNNASVSEIRNAYRKLALKWHPDRWTRDPTVVGEAKRRFQQIQEAYSVLSDEGKRAMYDAGTNDPFEEEDEGFSEFVQEMLSMMDNVRAEKEDSFEDLQKMFVEMVDGDGGGGDGVFNFNLGGGGGGGGEKRRRTGVSDSQGNASSKRGAHRVNMSTFSSSLEPFML